MITQNAFRNGLFVLTTVATIGSSLLAALPASASSYQNVRLSVSSTRHQGPGVGSVKTPPFTDVAYDNYRSLQAQNAADLSFHTNNDQSAMRNGQVWQGPGSWSVKAPGVR